MYSLAQVNIARMLAPLDDPLMAEFVAQLDPINALADTSPGFIWRLQTPEGSATSIRPFDDLMILVNLSVWQSIPEYSNYVYQSAHREVMKQRRQWFERFQSAYTVLWWIPEGHIPTVEEAKERLNFLNTHGPTSYAFTLKMPFPAPDELSISIQPITEECPV
jgi:Domain of unknown function (DUF3291)